MSMFQDPFDARRLARRCPCGGAHALADHGRLEARAERQPDQKGDRVKIAMSGKFLAYKTY